MSAPAAKAFSLPVMTIAPMRGVAVERGERAAELAGQRLVERVHALRPVEADDADAVARFDDDVLVGGAHRAFQGLSGSKWLASVAQQR